MWRIVKASDRITKALGLLALFFDPKIWMFEFLCVVDVGSSTIKWEDSKIWPAPEVELYDRQNPSLLRTFHSTRWKLKLDASCSTNEKTRDLIEHATHRFNDFCIAGAPHFDATVNPDGAILSELAGIYLRILDGNQTTMQHDMDESYRIRISFPDDKDQNWIELDAPTIFGALHGFETIKQLLMAGWRSNDPDDAAASVFVIHDTPLYIQDQPAYAYRGLMIDTARHYLPLQLIRHNLDVMTAHKLNVLHWHLTDSQSWPFLSERFPELVEAAYCPACVYTANDIGGVIAEAVLRGIRVVVEIDLPGHSQAIGMSHPEFLSPCGSQQRSEPLDVTETAVYDFVYQLYEELTTLFPEQWIHLGGDEVSLQCWKNSSKIQNWMQLQNMTSEAEVLQSFEQKLLQHVTTILKRRAIVWQDLYDIEVNLPLTTIIDIWKEWQPYISESLYNATEAGYDVLFSACWYLDHLNEQWWDFYQCNPRGFANLTHRQQDHILGGHASMWGEHVDATNFFSRVWPRASAVAEVLWSGSPNNTNTSLSYNLVQSRLERFRCWLVRQFAIPVSPIAPGYCGEGPITKADELMLSDG